jgi:hypothetical protein
LILPSFTTASACLFFLPARRWHGALVFYSFTTNYEIGRRIVEREQGGADRAQYGKEVIKELAERLASEFGNGFSKSNLEYMRRFYLAYPGRRVR